MLTGLVLLAIGAALLGYVVAGRQPAAIEAPSTANALKSSRPGAAASNSVAPEQADVEDLSDMAETQVMRVRSTLGNAVLEPLSDELGLAAPAIEYVPPRADPKVNVAYEEEAEEEEATSPQARILVTASGDTDRGQRRTANDDSLLVLPDHSLFAVADGMGGYAGGSVASALAVEALKRAFEHGTFRAELRSAGPIPRRGGELASSIMQAHQAVFSAARANPVHCKMGTTLVAARFSPNKQRVYVGHVGDSRCYRFRRGGLRQLTTDQTMSTVGLRGPHADDLLQAIGVTPDLSIDLVVDKPQAGDIYLLCSDGLNKMVSDRQIQQTLAGQRDLEAAVYSLIELANDAGGKDNVTVVLIKVLDRALHDIATIPSPPAEPKGWTKLPNVTPTDSCSSDDETVVGQLPPGLAGRELDPATDKHRS
ncbi:MAG TPA: protein phosphatase 2C domain-containing protein [Polyangiaceae bacterium]|nr:protein phosphatase 2C domain-containing protein [Polyangiaceae bacterium]